MKRVYGRAAAVLVALLILFSGNIDRFPLLTGTATAQASYYSEEVIPYGEEDAVPTEMTDEEEGPTPEEPQDPDGPEEGTEPPEEPKNPDEDGGPAPEEPEHPNGSDGEDPDPTEPEEPHGEDGQLIPVDPDYLDNSHNDGDVLTDDEEQTAPAPEDPSPRADGSIEVSEFAQLRDLIRTGSHELYIVLTQDIYLQGEISVPVNRVVTVDGQKQFLIDQVDYHRFMAGAGSTVTLKDMTVVGRYEYGIIQHVGEFGTAIFDNITYSGPQPYYSSSSYGSLVIRNGGKFDIMKQPQGFSTNPQEFCENNNLTFEGGEVEINHAQFDTNPHSVFFITNGNYQQAFVKLTDGAKVTVRTRNYVFYGGVSPVPFLLEDGTTLIVEAAGFNRGTGHQINQFTVGDNAYFSYKQSGTPFEGGAMRAMYITGELYIGKNSTFLYESSVGIRTTGPVTLNAPKLVSIYGTASAFPEQQKQWTVQDVNAVNYWTDSSSAAPSQDAATNWPDHIWNTWYDTGEDTYRIGEPFSFSGNGSQGITAGGDLYDALERGESTLKDVLKLNSTAKRLVIGNIDLFEVMKVNTAQDGIYGTVEKGDIAAYYPAADGAEVTLEGEGFPLFYGHHPKPTSGKRLTVVANVSGLRAAVSVESGGVLELLSAPQSIYYGRHEISPTTAVYERQSSDSQDDPGQMVVKVLDSRGEESTPWELVVESTGQPVNGKALLPASALIFVTEDGRELSLGNGAVVAHTQGRSEIHREYGLGWDRSRGLLAKVYPGALSPGEYAAVINWSVQIAPNVA